MNEITPTITGRGKNKRFWSPEEDKALVTSLSELAIDPHWRCENGFRNGYMFRLEEMIEKVIPGSGLKATPHIDSRIKTLVYKFKAFAQMLNTTDFKWDAERHMISVERLVYDEYCKTHPNCKKLYGQSFPHFYALMGIYDKDYAIGKPVEDFVDAVEEMQRMIPMQICHGFGDEEDGDASGSQSQTGEFTPLSKKAKREKTSNHKGSKSKDNGNFSFEEASFQSFMKNINVHLSTMASALFDANAREKEVVDRKKKVLRELLALESITPDQAYDVAEILMVDPHKLILFFESPDNMKLFFVERILRKKDNIIV